MTGCQVPVSLPKNCMNPLSSKYPRLIIGVILGAIASNAQERPYSSAGTGLPVAPPAPPISVNTPAPTGQPSAPKGAVEEFLQGKIPDAIAHGKFSVNARLRFEFVDQDGVPAVTDPSYAPTLRTRFGYTTAQLFGFQAMLEAEDIRSIGPEHNFNAAGTSGVAYKPVVADPSTTELNQAWLSYSYTNQLTIKAGRQRITLDNHRFVGDVGWRQNMQTFDAVAAEGKPIEDVALFYSYLWDVHRVFGGVDDLAPGNRDFSSSSHLLNASYAGWKLGRIVGYSYLLDLENSAGNAASSATYGAYFAGAAPVCDSVALGYRAEFAWQTDYADSPFEYETEYYSAELSATMKPFSIGAGYEVLGSDNQQGFRTPLATLHAFNGWADVFLNTPTDGLRDLYAFGQVTFPWEIPLRVVYHKYNADSGNDDYGQEFDAVATKKFGKHWSALLKYSFYDGKDAAPPGLPLPDIDVHKFWAQVEFNY